MAGRNQDDAVGLERHRLNGVSVVDCKTLYAYCSAAYIVTPKGKVTLESLFSSDATPAAAIDMLLRDWIADGRLNAKLTVPFLASPPFSNASTIPYSVFNNPSLSNYEGLLSNAVRRLLFAGESNIDFDQISKLIKTRPASVEYETGMRLYETLRGGCKVSANRHG